MNVFCYCYPTGGLSIDSCSPCPPGHYCSIEGLASPSGLCAAGFYCPFDFSSTTPYAFLCPKVSPVLLVSLLSTWTTVEPQRFEPQKCTDWLVKGMVNIKPGRVLKIFYCGLMWFLTLQCSEWPAFPTCSYLWGPVVMNSNGNRVLIYYFSKGSNLYYYYNL